MVGCEIDRDCGCDSFLTYDWSAYRNSDAARHLARRGADLDELLVPAKPFGFLAAALNEYEPARPEVHRSRVRPDPRRSLLARMSFRGESLLRGEPLRGE